MKSSKRIWKWVGVAILAMALAHAAIPHNHENASDASRCAIHASGSGNYVAGLTTAAALLLPPAAPESPLVLAAADCAAPQSPSAPRAPPSEVLS